MHRFSPLALFALVGLTLALSSLAGCHALHDCPILQPMTGGRIPAPLPPKGETYALMGYRDGIRFFLVKYTDNLYRGGDILSPQGAETLRALGVKTVVSTTPNDRQRDLCRKYGFKMVELPFGYYNMTKEHLNQFLAIVDTQPGPVYVHDFGGIWQAGILLAHCRIHRQGWTADQAIAEYRRLGANFWDSLHMVKVLKENAPI